MERGSQAVNTQLSVTNRTTSPATNHTDNPENQKWGGRLQGNASVMSSLASKTFKMVPNVEFFIGLSFRGLEAVET